ncbi:hypothetical protein [Flavobacterium rhizosphaerae]|uniref:50S ribosomal protein L27 n=1 Tax=Flavobacterium rhizosphaerae TaxID=3163298 RepID=A0ABW8Z006_9FLAO
MYSTILELHSYWAYGVLFFLLLAILNSFVGLSKKKLFDANDRKIALIALIFAHVQLVLGLIMWIISPDWDNAKAAGGVMKDSLIRLHLIEHPLINIIAITVITIGWSQHKKAIEDSAKFKKIAIMYLIGLVLLLSRIPYGQWFS